MIIDAIIPARSGSKGLPDKNIKILNGKPLIAYSIEFAKSIKCINNVYCSTDSQDYADIALKYGASVPFLRSKNASSDIAMEQDILIDIYKNLKKSNIVIPDLVVWLRPTFVFRNKNDVIDCINKLVEDDQYTSARTVCETESRIYKFSDKNKLKPIFDDKGRSMIRRQDIEIGYKVYSTDVIRFKGNKFSENFLGNNVYGKRTDKINGLDIDDLFDFKIVESVMNNL